MTEAIPTVSILMTDFGAFTLSQSVSDKIAAYPKVKFRNPFADDDVDPYDVTDLNHPPMARYYRLISNHMKREWLKVAIPKLPD